MTSLKTGISAARADIKILSIGLIQSLFEGAMYSWVFIWTPALQRGLSEDDHGKLPFGWIFASFMVCVMIGSVIFGYLSKKISVELLARPVYLLGSLSLLVASITTVGALFSLLPSQTPMLILRVLLFVFFEQDTTISFLSFLVFEVVCGMHWPLTGTLKGKYIPEESRSAVMNLMRLPLNLIVVVVLLKVASMEISTVFGICFLLLLTCFGFTFTLPAPSLAKI